MTMFVDLHVLQTVPPSNINRDDTGSPKTAVYGGVRRARVSSQAWKRAIRTDFAKRLDPSDLGVRTRRVVELVAREVAAINPSMTERSTELAEAVLTASGIKLMAPKKPGKTQLSEESEQAGLSGYLMFFSHHQIHNLAALALEFKDEPDPAAALKKTKRATAMADSDHSIDVALFGRMVADQGDLTVDACAQVAHAISVHPVDTEFDYFTAVDDLNTDEETGAGMIGTVEFNSSTLYRYATVNVDALRRTLGDGEATARAVEAFVESFTRSMPTGKQNTFANGTLPEVVVAMVRTGQPINLVQAFEEPVQSPREGSRVVEAAQRLVDTAQGVTDMYGEKPELTLVAHQGRGLDGPLSQLAPAVPLAEVVSEIGAAVRGAARGVEARS